MTRFPRPRSLLTALLLLGAAAALGGCVAYPGYYGDGYGYPGYYGYPAATVGIGGGWGWGRGDDDDDRGEHGWGHGGWHH